jgi:LPXTG-motif cell wall-anchored protein
VYGGELPFTGNVFTLPLVLIGLALTLGGWVLRRRSRASADATEM